MDSADPSRFCEAKDELFSIISNTEMARIPILVLANKQDIEIASPIDSLIHQLQLGDIPAWQKWNIQGCSAKKGEGIMEGLQSFSRMVKEYQKQNKT